MGLRGKISQALQSSPADKPKLPKWIEEAHTGVWSENILTLSSVDLQSLPQLISMLETPSTLKSVQTLRLVDSTQVKEILMALSPLLAKAPNFETLSIKNSTLDEETFPVLQQFLHTHSNLKCLSLVGDASPADTIEKLSASIAALPLESFCFVSPRLTPEQALIGALAAANSPFLKFFSVGMGYDDHRPYPRVLPLSYSADQHDLLEKIFTPAAHKNLRVINIDSPYLQELIAANKERAEHLAKAMTAREEHHPDVSHPNIMLEIQQRLPAIIQHAGEISGVMLDTVRKLWLNIISQLPGLPNEHSLEAFITPNEHGYAPLDNPDVLQEIASTLPRMLGSTHEQQYAALEQPHGQSTVIGHILSHGPADRILTSLNDMDLYVGAAQLLDEKGKPNATYAQMIESGKVASLFCKSNQKGMEGGELKKLLNALPGNVRKNLPGIHTLLAKARPSESKQQSCP